MRDETKRWLRFADENLRAAELLLESELHNPCLQNIQQTVEKILKAVLVEHSIGPKRTHSINELAALLKSRSCGIDIDEDECDLLDSIYIPSKYPLGSALPDFEPARDICERCIDIAKRVRNSAMKSLGES